MSELFKKVKFGECPECGASSLTVKFKVIEYSKLSPNGYCTSTASYPKYVGEALCHECFKKFAALDLSNIYGPGVCRIIPKEAVGYALRTMDLTRKEETTLEGNPLIGF